MRVWLKAAFATAMFVPGGAAFAQKNPGITIPTGPMTPPASAIQRPPAFVPPNIPNVSASQAEGSDPAAERVARGLPLDPQTRDLRDRLPPDLPAVERALHLRPPVGSATDMRGRTPSAQEIVDALAPR